MRTSNLIKKAAVVSLLILSGLFFSKCYNVLSGEKSVSGNTQPVTNFTDKICKLIKTDELRKAFSNSKGNKLILNIYPVKLSKSSGAKDFDLKFFFQDGLQQNEKIDQTGNMKLFEAQSEWYISFLKNNNVPMNKVRPGYFIEIDKTFLVNTTGLSVCLEPGKENLQYFLLSEKSEKDFKAAKDTTCRCPPVCCDFTVVMSDTTGRCPPICPTNPLLYESILKSIIVKKYKSN